ncbi:hypothetical protein SAMN05216405_2077 [Lachnospiraceae bacterium NLAE-zl-G231]|nr:hypothetical protein SAMN05216405_2077 [Lachnospiraceae bacterium NLAE-zl-G231]
MNVNSYPVFLVLPAACVSTKMRGTYRPELSDECTPIPCAELFYIILRYL